MTPMSLSEFHFIGISLTVTLLAMFFLLPLAAGEGREHAAPRGGAPQPASPATVARNR